MTRWRLTIAAALAAGLVGPGVHAQGLHGRLAVTDEASADAHDSLAGALGERRRNDATLDLRLTWARRAGPWDFAADYELTGRAGPGVALARAEAGLFAPPPATWLDLTGTIADRRRQSLTQKIDRLSVGYAADKLVVRLGRQAITWGAGQVFRPMDLIDPFAPEAVDTDYKPGVDLAYAQWLFDDGSDLQVIAAPRPARRGGAVTADASTFALHWHGRVGGLGTTAMAARDRGDWTAALGLSGALGGAVWNLEAVPTWEADGGVRTSALANISNAVTLAGRNATVFAEYFHNGFGVGDDRPLDALPNGLSDRLSRGQLFNTGRDYLAAGLTLEWTPLVTLTPVVIANLSDGGAYLAGDVDWSLSDNAVLKLGVRVPVGRDGSEYGGRAVGAGSPLRFAPPASAYVQLRRYF